MVLPKQVFLRHQAGDPIGPLPLRSLEVLYDSRVVGNETPLSLDGEEFKAISQWPEIIVRLVEVKELLGAGEDPWKGPAAETRSTSFVHPSLDGEVPLLRMMLQKAASQSSGRLELESASAGKTTITYKDGKIVSVETNIEGLGLAEYLLEQEVCDEATLEQGKERAPMMGGDLGGALISTGAIEPHIYFEKFIAWATSVLGAAVSSSFDSTEFVKEEVVQPPVPLGFDRLGILIEVVRSGMRWQAMSELLMPKRPCPLIPSQVEGVSLDDCKLKPKEIRVLRSVDGVKTLGALIDTLGGSEEKTRPILQAVYFAEQTGFIVFGEDRELKKEVEEAKRINKEYEKLSEKHYFEILNVTEKSSDEEVRAVYTDYAKKYHPDKLRSEAAPELLEARREFFALISEAFEALETEDMRFKYASDLEQGVVGSTADLQKVQNALTSETLFKKAEVFLRVRKYKEALSHLREAIELNPEDTEFKIYEAYAEYLTHASKGASPEEAHSAIKKILDLMRNQANIASGYLFLGHLHKAVEKPELAVKYFERVLEYDESNQEAMREVRLASMRKDKKKKRKWL